MRTFALSFMSGWMKVHDLNPKFRSFLNTLAVIFKICFLAITIFLFGGNENANPTVGNSTVEFYSSEFRQRISSEVVVINNGRNNTLIDSLVNRFFSSRQYMPAWTRNFKTAETYNDLISMLESATSFGFYPSMYSVDELNKLSKDLSVLTSEENKLNARIELEKIATASAFKLMVNLSAGLSADNENPTYVTLINNLPDYLNFIINSNEVKEGVLKLQPQSEQYQMLQAALVKFVQNVTLSSVEYSVENFTMSKGLTEKILVEQGYLDKAFMNDTVAIKSALQSYQVHNSLKSTGAADETTLKMLGRSTTKIFEQIAINLDRLRKDELKTNNYILVNIPEFVLRYVNESGSINRFNVVVGKNDSPTPLLESKIEQIVTNPHWTVPNSIAFNEILPKVKTDSGYLAKHGYKIVDKDAKAIDESSMDWHNMNQRNFKYYIRQDNGEKNALGTLKFLFPNEYSVYLHDTPSKQYFKKDIRNYSHGCVRVENPEKLAEIIVTDHCSNGREISIRGLLRTKKQHAIRIDEPVQIYIKYYTCTADSNGGIYFHPDVYSYDNEAIEQLFASNYQE